MARELAYPTTALAGVNMILLLIGRVYSLVAIILPLLRVVAEYLPLDALAALIDEGVSLIERLLRRAGVSLPE